MSGARHGGHSFADIADGAVLHGDGVLLCKKLGVSAPLIRIERRLQKAPAIVRRKARNAAENEADDTNNGNAADGLRLRDDGSRADRQGDTGMRVGISHYLFLLRGKDY